MRRRNLPSPIIFLCYWLAGVKSENAPIFPSNGTIGTTGTSSSTSSFSSNSNTGSITQAPTSKPSGAQVVPVFTGDSETLVDWCFSIYEEFLNASGTPSTVTSSHTGTYSDYYSTTTSLTTYEATYTFITTLVPTPFTPPAACFTGCIIDADRVRLDYWPTPRANETISEIPATITPAPIVSAIVDGRTLISPSNYLIFTDIYAVSCPFAGPCTTIGDVVHRATMSFGQDELVTENCFHAWGSFNYADFNTPIPWSIVSTQIGCTLITESHPGSEPNYDFTLLPNIMFPQAVRTAINPDWASCTFVGAVYDPPSALTPARALTSGPAPGTTPNPPVNPIPTTSPTLPPALPETTPPSAPAQTQDPPAPPTSNPDPPASTPDTVPNPPNNPPTAIPADPPTQSDPVDPPTQSNTGGPVNPPPVNSGTASPNDPPTQSDPVDPPTQSNPGDPSNQPPENPVTQSSNDPGSPTQPPNGQSPIQGPGDPDLGSIIGSVGGFNSPAPSPDSTITLPGQNTGANIPQEPILTTIPGVVTSIGGIETTLPGLALTTTPHLPANSSPVTATIGGNTITIAPDGASAIIGSQTLTAGGMPITVSSTVISLGPSGIVVGSTTIALATPTPSGESGTDAGFTVSTATSSGFVQASSGNLLVFKTGWGCLLVFSLFLFGGI